MKLTKIGFLLVGLVLGACGQPTEETSATQKAYTVLDKDLQQLKDDFNANEGRVRLMFLSGPTCGICLRGMADLNDAFIAEHQNDDRLVTFVVHVPTLGAKEQHVADTIPLLQGPKIHHYWEESGIIGRRYSDVMAVGMYVWDFWAIYGPEARWDGTMPPVPAYYEHQLGITSQKFRTFPQELVLDAERFAAKTMEFIEQVDPSEFAVASEPALLQGELQGDGTFIPVVAQPRNVAVSEHIRGRGYYRNLKAIQNITKQGHWEFNGQQYPFEIQMQRPNLLSRTVTVSGDDRTSSVLSDGTIYQANFSEIGLPAELGRTLLSAFEFDGPLVEWPDKGSDLALVGMLKIGDVLAWKLDLTQSSGDHWFLYIDSHGGALVRADLLNDSGKLEFSILQSDHRDTDGVKFPYRIEYRSGEGDLLAVEIFDSITIEQAPFELSEEPVSH